MRDLSRKQPIVRLSLVLLAIALLSGAAEAAYPERPVHLVVGFTPGTGGDTLARLIGAKLAKKWGQPVLVENHPGASNTTAEGIVAHSTPDGYTLAMVNATHTVTPSQFKLAYDPIKSFAPVSRLTTQPDVLVVQPSFSAQSLKDLIALAKTAPIPLYYGSSGIGGAPYLEMVVLMNRAKLKMTNINYPGSAEALLALQRGEVQLMFGSVQDALPLVKTGKLRALAVSAGRRIGSLEGVPTVAEAADLPDYDVAGWQGVLAPAATPRDIVIQIHDDLVAAMNMPDIRADMDRAGDVVIADTPEEFSTFIESDIAKWAKLVKPVEAK